MICLFMSSAYLVFAPQMMQCYRAINKWQSQYLPPPLHQFSADSKRVPASTALFPMLVAHPYREVHNMCSSHSTHLLFSMQIWKVKVGSTKTFGTQAGSYFHCLMTLFHCLRNWVVDIPVGQVVRQIYVMSHSYQTVTNDSEAAIMGSYIT